MGWGSVWQLTLKTFGAEAVEVRLAILLAAALVFALVMIGLKHAFRPAEAKSSAPEPIPAPPKRIFAAPVAAAAVAVEEPRPPAHVPLRVPQPSPRKRVKQTVNRHRAVRPRIRGVNLPGSTESRPGSSPKR